MKRILMLLVIAAMLLLTVNAFAQNNTQGFGVHFGNVSGNGYAYRYITDKLGIQLVVGGITSGNNDFNHPDQMYFESNSPANVVYSEKGRKYNFNLGGNIILPLRRTETSMFYLHAGANWKYSDQKYYHQDYQLVNNTEYLAAGDVYTSHKVKSFFNVGIGPGAEIQAGRYFKLALELPVTYTGDNEFIMYIPQAGLYYYFK